MTEDYKPMTDSNKKQPTASQSSTLVPYPNPEKVDREFYDLHGIPYPQSMGKEWLESESQHQTSPSQIAGPVFRIKDKPEA